MERVATRNFEVRDGITPRSCPALDLEDLAKLSKAKCTRVRTARYHLLHMSIHAVDIYIYLPYLCMYVCLRIIIGSHVVVKRSGNGDDPLHYILYEVCRLSPFKVIVIRSPSRACPTPS